MGREERRGHGGRGAGPGRGAPAAPCTAQAAHCDMTHLPRRKASTWPSAENNKEVPVSWTHARMAVTTTGLHSGTRRLVRLKRSTTLPKAEARLAERLGPKV